jgi:DNA recombination protein RmuC
METTLLIIAIFFLAVFSLLVAALYRKLSTQQKPAEGEQNLFVMLQNQLSDLSRTFDQKITDTQRSFNDTQTALHKTLAETNLNLQKSLGENQVTLTKTIQVQFGQSAKIIGEVTERLTKIDETNKQVVGFATQLQNLQDVLQNPKQRGILGEYFLETVLKNVLPPGNFQMQYKFSNGDIVDAVVFVRNKIIPIDSKFSLENYNRAIEETDPTRRTELEEAFKSDLKKRIDETSKYIKPSEGTMDFAFMFIPAEGIYYDLLVNKVGALKVNTQALIEYAFRDKKVIIVSPTSFLAYLQTVLQGLRGLQIEESAKEISKHVEELGKHLAAYDDYFKKLGNNLSTTVNSYNTAYKELGKIDKDVVRITEGEKKIEPLQLEKPTSGEE